MTTAKRGLAVATIAVLALGVTSCGGDGGSDSTTTDEAAGANEDFVAMSAEEIKDEVIADMKALTSMTMNANFTTDGETVEFDLSMDTDGNCTGSMSVGGGTAEILSVGGASYLKGDTAFWDASGGDGQGAMMEEMVGDRWAKMPAGAGGFESFCDLDTLLEDFDVDSTDTTIVKGEEGEVDGVPALQLTSDEDGGTTTMWVASSGDDHFILKIERSGDEAGDITMTDFNEPVEVTEPSEDDVIDLASLGG